MPYKAKCVDCGYLQVLSKNDLWDQLRQDNSLSPDSPAGGEVSLGCRKQITYRRFWAVDSLTCYRKIDLYPTPDKPIPHKELKRLIYTSCIDSHNCSYFIPYIPGLSPSEHLIFNEQSRQDKRRKMQLVRRLLLLAVTAIVSFALGVALRPALDEILFGIR